MLQVYKKVQHHVVTFFLCLCIAYKDCAICGSIRVLIPYFLLTGM
jgi:hypothetical protein